MALEFTIRFHHSGTLLVAADVGRIVGMARLLKRSTKAAGRSLRTQRTVGTLGQIKSAVKAPKVAQAKQSEMRAEEWTVRLLHSIAPAGVLSVLPGPLAERGGVLWWGERVRKGRRAR